jgi:hypothetical protein
MMQTKASPTRLQEVARLAGKCERLKARRRKLAKKVAEIEHEISTTNRFISELMKEEQRDAALRVQAPDDARPEASPAWRSHERADGGEVP